MGIRVLLLFAAISALTPGIETTPVPTGPRPIGDPSTWITPDDYPKAALRDGVEGKSGFILDVSRDGHVVDCNVTKPSGNDGLDAAACALLQDRAQFTPALDKANRPAPGTYRSTIVWQIPRNPPLPLTPMNATIAFDVDGTGHALNCAASGSSPDGPGGPQLCRLLVAQASFVPDAHQGKPVSKHVVVRFSVEVTDTPPRPN